MAAKGESGRLIAVEAVRGRDAEWGASKLKAVLAARQRRLPAGISRWDASGAFYELHLGARKGLGLSPRTLLLLYASDLAFRLRWEIRPALADGHVVIAAPYVETATAFGEAAGVQRKWIAELFRFAPQADLCLHVKDEKDGAPWKRRPMDGFPEFGAVAIGAANAAETATVDCARMVEALQRLKRPRCDSLRQKRLARLVDALTEN